MRVVTITETFGNIGALAERYDTPLVIYSEAQLLKNAVDLMTALPASTALAYSIKANPNPAILKCMSRLGLMAEAASAGELHLALSNGIGGGQLLLGGPAKSEAAIMAAIAAKAAAVIVESATDLDRVKFVAKTENSTIDVLIRVNPSQLRSSSVLRMAGVSSPFGIDEEKLSGLIDSFDNDRVKYAGLHLYAGSQHFLAEDIIDNTRYLCDLALRFCSEGYPVPRILDFGGGFGVPEDTRQPEINLSMLRRGLQQVYNKEVAELSAMGLEQTIFESGRYLVSRAGIYVSKVLDVKKSQGKRFAILDGGINNLGIRQLPYRTHEPRLEVWGRPPNCLIEPTVIVGPTCTPIDIIHKECYLPTLQVGDLVVISDFGAYTTHFSPIHFCGHPWPAEVLVMNCGKERLVRRRGLVEEACGLGYCDTV